MQIEIIVAVIAATAGWLGLILTKEQKVSEFRQKWVDELRQDIAMLVANSQLLSTKEESTNTAELKELLHVIQRIKYRLNPDDTEGLINYIDELTSLTVNSKGICKAQIEPLIKNINETGHNILKSEWERVKKGEPWFYWSKWGFLGVAITLSLASTL